LKLWLSYLTASKYYGPARVVVRVLYYYAIIMALFYIYLVQKQHTPAPFIYDQF
jgi:hypothetical protein